MNEYMQLTQKFILHTTAEQDRLDQELNNFCKLGSWQVHSWFIFWDDNGLRKPVPYKVYLLERSMGDVDV